MNNEPTKTEATETEQTEKNKKPPIRPKFLGVVLSLLFIAGAVSFEPKEATINENRIYNLIEKVKSVSNELEKSRNGKKILEEAYNDIKKNLEGIRNSVGFEKRVAVANIFFQHVMRLIFILSGILGLFWIFIWLYREEREAREIQQKAKIQK